MNVIRIPVALQLYSIRGDCAKDFADTLKKVAAMGYEGVEFAGYHGKAAAELRAILDGEGLRAAGAHVGLQALQGDDLARTLEFQEIIGNRFLVVPGLPPECCDSLAAWRRTAGLFNEISAAARARGLWVGIHNHAHAFEPVEGAHPWEVFFDAAHPDVVMQLDAGNAMHAGIDPAAWLKRYPGRALTVHLKEFARSGEPVLLGRGDVDWLPIFDICETAGNTRWYVVEQETYPFPPLECAARCLENLKRLRVKP